MAIYKGNKKVVAVYKGSTPINKIYKGSTLVFQKGGGGSTQSIEGTATGNFNININNNSIPITTDASGKWFYETDEKITSLSYVFAYKSAVTSVDLSNFDLTGVSTGSMFAESPNITSIKFNNTKIIKVEDDMYQMFYKCSSLVSLDLSNFDTSGFRTIKDLFSGCSALVSLNLSSFDTSNVVSTMSLFDGCSSLVSLDLSNFDMSKSKYYDNMFRNCTSLSTIKCKQTFKNWCSSNKSKIGLTNYSRINWEIVD